MQYKLSFILDKFKSSYLSSYYTHLINVFLSL